MITCEREFTQYPVYTYAQVPVWAVKGYEKQNASSGKYLRCDGDKGIAYFVSEAEDDE